MDAAGDYGTIAATNALNDVFAMGGTPLLALSIAAFSEEPPSDVLARVFIAAAEQVRAAGGLLAGGHTIRDDEPKYGLAVVGTVHPRDIWSKAGARPGDTLFLTKPLGTGLIMTGYKQRPAGERNCRQLGPERLGAGSSPAPRRMRLTLLGDTRRPSFSSSPRLRPFCDAQVFRCQRRSVCGVTTRPWRRRGRKQSRKRRKQRTISWPQRGSPVLPSEHRQLVSQHE